MKCPNCEDGDLRAVLTRQGVEIDHCDACEGVWLDRGEMFLFAAKPKRVAQALDQALAAEAPDHFAPFDTRIAASMDAEAAHDETRRDAADDERPTGLTAAG